MRTGAGSTRPRIVFKKKQGERPAIRVDFSRQSTEAGGDEVFRLGPLVDSLVSGLEANLLVKLRPGRVTIPLADGSCFVIVVPDGCTAACRVETGRIDEEASVLSITIEFAPAITLPNVFETLVHAQHLFGDPAIEALVDVFSGGTSSNIRPLLKAVFEGLEAATLFVREGTWSVEISRVELRPRRLDGEWKLVPWFGGVVRFLDRIEAPFWDVVLPQTILPAFSASLERLFSSAPDLRISGDRTMEMLRAIFEAIELITGDMKADVTGPFVEFATRSGDRTDVWFSACPPSHVNLSVRVVADFEKDKVRIGPSSIIIASGGRERFRAVVKATVNGWSSGRSTVTGTLQVADGAMIPGLELEFHSHHPLAVGGTDVCLTAKSIAVRGNLSFTWSRDTLSVVPDRNGIEYECAFEMPERVVVRRAKSSLSASLHRGSLKGIARRAGRTGWRLSFDWQGMLRTKMDAQVTPIPELKISDSHLIADTSAEVHVSGRALVLPEQDARVTPGGKARLVVAKASASLDGMMLDVPRGTEVTLGWKGGEITRSGLGEAVIEVTWDMHGKPCRLRGRAKTFSQALGRGKLLLHMSQGGRVSLGDGSHEVSRLIKAVMDPTRDPESILEFFKDGRAFRQVVSVIEAFDSDLASTIEDLRRFVERFKHHLESEGVKSLGDAIPRQMLSRLLSFAIVDNDSLAGRLEPIIKDVTEGKGIDIEAALDLLRSPLRGKRLEWEISGLIRWFDLVTRPAQVFPRAEAEYEVPIVCDSRYRDLLSSLPSAAEIYEIAEKVPPDKSGLERIAGIAPSLSLAQLEYILSRGTSAWPSSVVERLLLVRDMKKKVARLDEGTLGLTRAVQSAFIASFIGDAIGYPSIGDPEEDCLLGPRDVAVLLQAGLSVARQGAQAQINNRLLLELIRKRPGEFLREVLIEMGQQVPHVLSNVLFAFLNQDQDELKEPIDIAALVEEKLGMPVPRHAEFLAGGRRARESYYQALFELANAIIQSGGSYMAKRAWLREVRHPLPGPRRTDHGAAEAMAAKKAIAAADRLGNRAMQKGGPREEAVAAYRAAFAECAEFLRVVPDGFTEPWMKNFWLRNEEALKVLSVVRNWQEDVDDVRRWLTINAAGPVRADEDSLVETVVRTLYAYGEDQERLLADPLVRLMIDPEPGRYDFTIISCMGVITDGKDGRELEDSFRRITERRGVEVIRAHTGLFRSLEYNASAIIAAIKQAKTPWGYIGYSQGCANALMAENFLYGGTPEQRKLLDNFVCRNLLFSAANGSVHGSNGARKYIAAIIEGEMFLKHYQAIYSRELTDLILRTVKAVMDSRVFVNTLGGTYSLTLERARLLHRDGQFVPWVPTSTTRGVVTLDRIPEALEYLWWMHERLLPGVPSDSQVAAEEAVGYASRVRNEWTEVLRRCDMGSYVQATHHWSPVTAEIEIVTTERDRRLAVYQSPKDRHVFPWVEVNARFGRIKVTS